jgi:hypothetical protein
LVVLGLAAAVGFLAPRLSVTQLAMLAGAGGALLFLRIPELGLVAVLVAALCVPFAIGTGTQTPLHAAVLLLPLLLVLWLLDMLRRRSVRLVPSPTNVALVAFIVASTISLLGGQTGWNLLEGSASLMAQAGGWAVFVLSAGAFLLVGNQVRDLRWLRLLTAIFVAVGSVVVLARVFPAFDYLGSILIADGADGSLLWVWMVALAAGQAVANRSLSLVQRFALFGLALMTLGVGWFQGREWASGWAPGLVALLALVWLRSWRLGLAITLAGAAGIVLVASDLPAALLAGDQYSVSTRGEALRIILGQVLPANPVFGLGFGNYYFVTPLYPILGWSVRFNSHSQYVDILAQTGVVGMACFAWLMASIGRLGWRLRERAASGFARGYVYGCMAGLAGTLVAGLLGDWFLPFVYNIGLAGFRASLLGWMFLGGLVAVKKMGEDANQQASPSAGK